jgi:hypothetical protein
MFAIGRIIVFRRTEHEHLQTPVSILASTHVTRNLPIYKALKTRFKI